MFGTTAYTVGNVRTGLASNGIPLAMVMQGLNLPNISGGVPILNNNYSTVVPISTAPISTAPISAAPVVVNTTGTQLVPAPAPTPVYLQPQQQQVLLQQVAVNPGSLSVGDWKKTQDSQGIKYWVNTVTGDVSATDPLV